MFSIRRWIAAKMFAAQAQAAAAANNSRNRRLFPGNGSCSRNYMSNTSATNTLLQFYYADEDLNLIAAELDSFDGRKDPVRCTNLVNQLRCAQDKVISLIFRLMEEWRCERCSRDYRLKFPDDLMAGGDNGESLNGQIWFGAECLAAGSNIMNHEAESELLRPMAKTLTNTLDQLRMELRHACTDIDDSLFVFKDVLGFDLICKMEHFDRLFSGFELEYVKAMLPIKSSEEIEKLQEVTVLFSESVNYALKRGLLHQTDIDECQPNVMINIPRLAIVYGLTRCADSPIYRRRKEELSNLFKPFHNLLHRVRDLINALRPIEVEALEKLLINEDNALLSLTPFNETGELPVDLMVEHQRAATPGLVLSGPLSSGHQRRHSAPDLVGDAVALYPSKLKGSQLKNGYSLYMPTDNKRCASTVSLMNIISAVESRTSANVSSVHGEEDIGSRASLETTTTTSTVDSFEIALALNSRRSVFISPGTRQLLHRLFVTVAGIADQLQSNYASDLRTILRNIFLMYSSADGEEADDISVEEAFEVREDSSSGSSSSSSATTPTANSGDLTFGLPEGTEEPSRPLCPFRRSPRVVDPSSDTNGNQPTQTRVSPPRVAVPPADAVLIAPIWVPDELVSTCTSCCLTFNIIRRRHHCRSCGRIYCSSCSNHFVPLVAYGYAKPVRVCNFCISNTTVHNSPNSHNYRHQANTQPATEQSSR